MLGVAMGGWVEWGGVVRLGGSGVFMRMVGWKDWEGFSRKLECRESLGASSRSRLLRVTGHLEALALSCRRVKLADLGPPHLAMLPEPTRDTIPTWEI